VDQVTAPQIPNKPFTGSEVGGHHDGGILCDLKFSAGDGPAPSSQPLTPERSTSRSPGGAPGSPPGTGGRDRGRASTARPGKRSHVVVGETSPGPDGRG